MKKSENETIIQKVLRIEVEIGEIHRELRKMNVENYTRRNTEEAIIRIGRVYHYLKDKEEMNI